MIKASHKEFRTTLENFTGPLDLLLYLIGKNEIDILSIPVAEILQQYEEYVQILKEIDVNVVSEYLVMATTLMEIKSRMLLPQVEDEEIGEFEDPRRDLVRQLIEYRAYKEKALGLAEKLQENNKRFNRTAGNLPFPLKRIELAKLSIWDIVTSFLRIQKEIAANRPKEIIFTERPISYYMNLIQNIFSEKNVKSIPFEDIFLCQEHIDRNIMIGLFLSILELVRLGGLCLEKDEKAGGIIVTLNGDSLSNVLTSLYEQLEDAGADTAAAFNTEEDDADSGDNDPEEQT